MAENRTMTDALHEENSRLRQRNTALEQIVGHLLDELIASIPTDAGSDDSIPENGERNSILYRILFEHLLLPIAIFHPDGCLVTLNRQNQQFLPISRQTIVGKFNLLKNQKAVETGHAAAFQQALHGGIAYLEPVTSGTHEAESPGLLEPKDIPTPTMYFPLYDDTGAVAYIGAMYWKPSWIASTAALPCGQG